MRKMDKNDCERNVGERGTVDRRIALREIDFRIKCIWKLKIWKCVSLKQTACDLISPRKSFCSQGEKLFPFVDYFFH